MKEIADGKELCTRVLHGMIDLLALQLIREEPMMKNKLVQKMSSRFNVSFGCSSVYPVLYSLQNKELILNGPGKVLTLTEKGEQIRQRLIDNYVSIQKIITMHLQ